MFSISFFQLVHFHYLGLSINPNVLKSGDVRLALPKTFADGSVKYDDIWVASTSTMLQVLVCIQSLILNKEPLFNDFMYFQRSSKHDYREYACLVFNENTIKKSLRTMVYVMNKPPKVRF